jgi:putative serine protease PepD
MPIPKMLAGGVAAALALGGGGVITHELLHSPQTTAAGSTTTTAGARSIAIDATTARRVYDGAKNAVAYIVSDTSQGQATGSGFVVSKDGLIVTNEHVVDGAQQVQVKVGTTGQAQDADVVGVDASHDLALLKVKASKLPALPLGNSSSLSVGDATYAIGNPYGLDHTLTSGIVSALHRELQSPNGSTISDAVQTDAALNPGNSGGPLLDASGKVIGVNAQIQTGSSNGAEGGNVGIGFAIPVNTVKTFVAQAETGKLSPQQQPQAQADPYDQGQQADPYDQGQQADPYDQGQQADPYGLGIG